MTRENLSNFWRLYRRNYSAVFGLMILATVIGLAATAHLFYPGDPFKLAGKPMSPPVTEGFLLGSDSLGRDVAAGIAHGAKTSIDRIGGDPGRGRLRRPMGRLAGYYGGWIDDLLMRTAEMFQVRPSSLRSCWRRNHRSRASSSPSRSSPGRRSRAWYAASSCRCATASSFRPATPWAGRHQDHARRDHQLLLADYRHRLAHGRDAILIGLSFLGLGDPNIMSWGFLIGAGRTVLRSAWWVCTFPGVAILITVLAINLVGEGLNDALNPRLRERR